MFDKPDFLDEKIIACLQADFELGIVEIAFLPLGNNMNTAVYRALAMVLDLLGRAEQLAHVMVARSIECVVCHTDLHPGNLFIDTTGALFIVDWDYPALAPKERDLMFIGGGQGFRGRSAQEEQQRFYRGYGRAQIDPITLAYYRYERNSMDIVVACEQILSSKQGGQDRAQALEYLKWSFMPDCAIEIALKMPVGI